MLATAGSAPEDGDLNWAVEFKWDGIRSLAQVENGICRIVTRNGNTITSSFPEVSAALVSVAAGRPLTVDGEIVAPDPATGAPKFARIGRRLGVVRPNTTLRRDVPVQMYVFDLLELDGIDLRTRSYIDRRKRLTSLELARPLVESPYWVGAQVSQMLSVAADHDVEGLVAKRVDS